MKFSSQLLSVSLCCLLLACGTGNPPQGIIVEDQEPSPKANAGDGFGSSSPTLPGSYEAPSYASSANGTGTPASSSPDSSLIPNGALENASPASLGSNNNTNNSNATGPFNGFFANLFGGNNNSANTSPAYTNNSNSGYYNYPPSGPASPTYNVVDSTYIDSTGKDALAVDGFLPPPPSSGSNSYGSSSNTSNTNSSAGLSDAEFCARYPSYCGPVYGGSYYY